MWDYALSGMLLGLTAGYILGYMKGSSYSKPQAKKKVVHVDCDDKPSVDTKVKTLAQSPLSRDEEFKIINSFRKLEGMNYYDAMQIAQSSSYNLRPLYLNYTTSRLTDFDFNIKTLGVRVDEYPITANTKVLEIIDVGGIDRYNRGSLFF